ncbi:putative neuromedin-B receptor-like [Apostichopus japonicus]|uniref:Putative neuromedin-B receptor-like n=1 Tax=Stichopus japonicus TaxID=307972 RepID=A0A2G8LGU7_STIJA|nr:putative neuromedin-B receptor-like [Apostichopus japonicus]
MALVTEQYDYNMSDNCILLQEITSYKYFVITVLSILFVVGILANGSLILLFIRVKGLRDTNNAFIANLAIGDLLYTTIFIPIRIFEQFYYLRPFGLHFCYFSMSMNYISQDVSIFSLTALSILRFRAVVFPLLQPPRRRKCVTMTGCLAIWVVSAFLAMGAIHKCDSLTFVDCSGKVWQFHWLVGSDNLFKWYSVMQFAVLFLVPLVVISILYGTMAYKLFCVNLPLGNSSGGSHVNRSRQRLATIVLILVITFALCWFPYHIYSMIDQFQDQENPILSGQAKTTFREIQFILTMLSSVANPLILYLTSSSFRNHLVNLFCNCCENRRWIRVDTNITTVRPSCKPLKQDSKRCTSPSSTTAV